MRDSMPIGEINVDEIVENAKKYQETLSERKKELHKDKINALNKTSLSKLANNEINGRYAPFLLEFGLLLNKLKDNDNCNDIDSLQIRIDITEQILKMKKVPPFSTECHIESKDPDKCTSVKSLISKKLFRQKKYKLIFHRREATFEDEYFKSNIKKKVSLLAIFEFIFLLLPVLLFNSYILFLLILIITFITMFFMA